jgi:3-deoxy-7-phosphoheptulonate synthase
MIVVMEPGATPEHVKHVVALIEGMGLKTHPIVGTDRTVVAALGDKRNVDKSALENAPFVERVMPILAPYKRASREVRKEATTVEIGPARFPIGGPSIGVIAGPCSVEDRAMLIDTADAVKAAGAIGLRGGAFKPRTDPYSFRGLGEKGLEILAEARERTGLAIVTEIMSEQDVALVARYTDVMQIGARNMQNFNLLMAVAHAGKPVLLKRGMSATFDEFLLAAEYIMNEGNPNVILCERGIRTHETYVRNTLPLAIVPAVKRKSHLPILIDPSHGTGHAFMVPSMCRAAVAAGADGLIVEVHPNPEHALTDGAQSLTPEAFGEAMTETKKIAGAMGRGM